MFQSSGRLTERVHHMSSLPPPGLLDPTITWRPEFCFKHQFLGRTRTTKPCFLLVNSEKQRGQTVAQTLGGVVGLGWLVGGAAAAPNPTGKPSSGTD